jgi:hypothetical protein
MIITEGDKFCTLCGKELSEYRTDLFNPKDGNPKIKLRCHNPKCYDGCFNLTGHIMKGSFFGTGGICKLCGYDKSILDILP